jgi:hypothetical protein
MAVSSHESQSARLSQALVVSASSLLGVAVVLTIARVWSGLLSLFPIVLGVFVMAGLIGAALPRIAWAWKVILGAATGFVCAWAIGVYAMGQI